MKTVLVADDKDGNREIMRVVMETLGFRVVEARNGEEALSLAREHQPSLMLIDIQMPKLDGYEVIRLLREDSAFAQTPAIAVTAYAMAGDKEKAIAAGFTAHMAKPLDLKALRALSTQLLDCDSQAARNE